MPKGNIGTIAAQRALFKLLIDNNIDLSVSTPNPDVFKLTHPESRGMKVYGPLTPSVGNKTIHNYLQWVVLTAFNLTLFTFMASLMQIGVKFSSRADVIDRMRKCDALIDLNLELLRGVPISVSPTLIKRKPRVLIIHKLFWSFRILQNLWFLIIAKCISKKKLILGPASFGPFDDLPIIVRWLIKVTLTKFINLILVREPFSAKLLDKLGIRNYQLVADTALIDESNDSSSVPPHSSKQTIGVAPAMLRYTLTEEENENYIMAHAKCLDDFIIQGEEVIFLPSSLDDVVMSKRIMSKMKYAHQAKIIITNDVNEYQSVIRGLKLLITTRMHPSIIAAKNFIPFISIIYDHKQIGFLSQIGLKNFSISIGGISYDSLKLKINEVIQNHTKIKEKMKFTIPKLQEQYKAKLLYSVFNLNSLSQTRLCKHEGKNLYSEKKTRTESE